MTDATAGAAGAAGTSEAVGPRIQVHVQYVKDLSFENPAAPRSLAVNEAPKIEVSVDVGATQLTETQFEVELRIVAEANRADHKAFVVELLYGGVFSLHNIDPTALKAVCLIECPRIMFPFARRILADATRDGGFPPLLLEPIDFALLFRQQQTRQAQQPEADGPAPGA